jgi:hypothetical protein
MRNPLAAGGVDYHESMRYCKRDGYEHSEDGTNLKRSFTCPAEENAN